MQVSLKQLKKSKLYSEELGIDLSRNSKEEIFKWFLASILFGARISETIAKNTYRTFEKYKLLSPEKILAKDIGFLINPIMREGGYVRYDGKASNQVIRNCRTIMEKYDGDLRKVHMQAANQKDLERRIKQFYGVGPVTVNIFLRELRPFWPKANPEPLSIVKKLASKCTIDLGSLNRKSLEFARVEAGLIGLRKEF